MSVSIKLELCCADIHSVQLAELYNVPAVEFCIDLTHGGLTPSAGLIRQARSLFSGELGILIRPRKGTFVYNALEQEVMLEDVRIAVGEGADSVVFACLRDDDRLNASFMEKIIPASQGVALVFNRAIDICNHPELLIQDLINYQIDRVLTSGRARVITDGLSTIQQWMSDFGDVFQWVLCGKLNAANCQKIMQSCSISRVHGALSATSMASSSFVPFDLGAPETLDQAELKTLLKLLQP